MTLGPAVITENCLRVQSVDSRITSLPSIALFLRGCRSFSSRKLCVCLETLMFLSAIWSSLCFSCSMYRFIPPLVILVPRDSNVAVYTQVFLLFCALYMPLFGLIQVLLPVCSILKAFTSTLQYLSEYWESMKSCVRNATWLQTNR